MAECGLTAADIHQGFARRGVTIASSTPRMWVGGGNVHDKHRLTLAAVLDVPIALLQTAASLREMERAELAWPDLGNDELLRAVA